MPHRRALLLVALLPGLALAGGVEGRTRTQGPACAGEYADFLSSLRQEIRSFEASDDASYTYLIRSTAIYEHVYYGRGGKLRRAYLRHVRHGTGFAYRSAGGEWFVATNEHVAEAPEVTGPGSELEGIPAGSRKVRESLRIVQSEADDDEATQIPLTRVAADPALDAAVLKTRHPLRLLPYRLGRSAGLKVGNAVHVRGYPLAAFAASNTGRVTAVAQPDREKGWSHEDFTVDALLNSGNSGSPVFAISCKTGELELVGIYHAGYVGAQALNVVVSIDQLRPLLDRLEVGRAGAVADAAVDRAHVLAALRGQGGQLEMPFGDRVVRAEALASGVRFALLATGYPLSARVAFEVESPADGAAALLRPSRAGQGPSLVTELPAPLREELGPLEDALWGQLEAVLQYRAAELGRSWSLAASLGERIRLRREDQREELQAVDFAADGVYQGLAGLPGRAEGAPLAPAAR
ncbi:MAG TPA: serine protease [Anaeromyxobacteraceae bacterium]|jgi:serine protease Do|nr:serine protease [Anaeromyxobacteraceae bacterium]